MDRRNFIKLTAVTGSAAALASCGNPEHQLIRFIPLRWIHRSAGFMFLVFGAVALWKLKGM